MKRYLALLVSVWLMLALAWAAEAVADNYTILYVHTEQDALNGRRDPDIHSPIEMSFDRGKAVEVLRIQDGWAEIKGGEPGTVWSLAKYLRSYKLGEDTPLYTVVSNRKLLVRKRPDIKANTVDGLRYGDVVEVRFILDGWACLDQGRYVMAEYLEANSDGGD